MRTASAVMSGVIFGLGLIVSGMINPAKVLNFLDIAGPWDPSLAFVMAAAVTVTALGYRVAFARGKPLTDVTFHLPATHTIDKSLLGGAALFGIGWGLVGYCPGPAVAALPLLNPTTLIFVVAMIGGMAIARHLKGS